MTVVGLTTHERTAVELALDAAGFRPIDNDREIWCRVIEGLHWHVRLREVFPSPFTITQARASA